MFSIEKELLAHSAMPLGEVSPLGLKKRQIGGGVDGFVVDGVLAEEEAAGLVERCDSVGYFGIDHMYSVEQRNNDRSFIINRESADVLFGRVKGLLPQKVIHEGSEWALEGFHDIFRINRYRSYQYFKGHRDTPYVRGLDARSFYSILFYLNTVEAGMGGRTVFLGSGGQVVAAVEAAVGRMACFNHATLHSGEELLRGQKHAMRTDAIYSRKPP